MYLFIFRNKTDSCIPGLICIWILLLLFKVTFFIVVQLQLSHLSPHCFPLTRFLPFPQSILPPHIVCAHGSSIGVLWLAPTPSLPCHLPPLCSLSVCSLFPSLWFYFALLFILLIRFHSWVRSYGICLPLPGLLHLA